MCAVLTRVDKGCEHTVCVWYSRVRNEKIDINEINWTPNQHKEYYNLYIHVKTAKRAATALVFKEKN